MDSEIYERRSIDDDNRSHRKESTTSRLKIIAGIKAPSLNKNKELLDKANSIWKLLHLREIKNIK